MIDSENIGAQAPETSPKHSRLADVQGTAPQADPSNPKGIHFNKHPIGRALIYIFVISVAVAVAAFVVYFCIGLGMQNVKEHGVLIGIIITIAELIGSLVVFYSTNNDFVKK